MRGKPPVPNKTILEILELLDTKPSESRPVLFRFSSHEESLLYRLASVLNKRGYEIEFEKPSSDRWNCLAECQWPLDGEPLDRLCLRMVHLAEKHEVLFEGWETVISGRKTAG
jgi:regulator of RNase E activity RraB